MAKKIIDDKIFDDVFEAIRRLDAKHPILNLKDKAGGYLIRNNSFRLMELPDGTIGAFPPQLLLRFYRGEPDDFDPKYRCVPKIYRIKDQEPKDLTGNRHSELVLIDSMKITEFGLVAEEFPQVSYAIEDYCNVDFKALAQHYDLNTDLLDMSSDIAVAAFFATHAYDPQNGFQIREKGKGCLRVYTHIPDNDPEAGLENFRLIGLQPFQRPGIQCAFALRLNKGEDFSTLSGKALFKQDAKWNSKLHEAFYTDDGRNILFPEEEISRVAEKIKNSDTVSRMAVQKFCERNDYTMEYVEKVLAEHDIRLTEKLTYSLSRQQRKKMEKDFKDSPYGNVKLISRGASY